MSHPAARQPRQRRTPAPPPVFGMQQPPLFRNARPLPVPQPLNFDAAEGRRLQEDGAAAALSSRAAMPWTEQAERWLLLQHSPFTADDLVDAIGLPRGAAGQNQNNAVGALMRSWSHRGVIHAIGLRSAKRVESHGRAIRVWSR